MRALTKDFGVSLSNGGNRDMQIINHGAKPDFFKNWQSGQIDLFDTVTHPNLLTSQSIQGVFGVNPYNHTAFNEALNVYLDRSILNQKSEGVQQVSTPQSTPAFSYYETEESENTAIEVDETASTGFETNTASDVLVIDGSAEHLAGMVEIAKNNTDSQVVGYNLNAPPPSQDQAPPSGNQTPPPPNEKQKLDVNTYLKNATTEVLVGAVKGIHRALEENPNTDIISLSIGNTKNQLYNMLSDEVLKANDPAIYAEFGLTPLDGLIINTIDRGSPTYQQSELKKKYEQSIADKVDSYIAGEEFQSALKGYQDYTKELADKGITVVASMANQGNPKEYWAPGASDQEVNLLAMSEHVISVGGSTDNTPTAAHDPIASVGGGQWKPTIAADSTDISVDGSPKSGTSVAVPQVVATLAEMKQANPNLSFADQKKILQETAFDTPATELEEGAGVLNTQGAVQMAGLQPAAGDSDLNKVRADKQKADALYNAKSLLVGSNSDASGSDGSLSLSEAQAYYSNLTEDQKNSLLGKSLYWLTTDGHWEQISGGTNNAITMDILDNKYSEAMSPSVSHVGPVISQFSHISGEDNNLSLPEAQTYYTGLNDEQKNSALGKSLSWLTTDGHWEQISGGDSNSTIDMAKLTANYQAAMDQSPTAIAYTLAPLQSMTMDDFNQIGSTDGISKAEAATYIENNPDSPISQALNWVTINWAEVSGDDNNNLSQQQVIDLYQELKGGT
jgi:hypothetical protein